jgi:predicted molibdopterin-dependent oxidoreductase YjgC
VFGAGGGTSSYREVEDTDVVLLWGSNARAAHPIFFHHLLKGVHNGARLFVVDPRRTESAQWADRWLGLDVGSDIALSHAMAREIIHAGLANRAFVEHATSGYDEYAACVEPFTLEEGERLTGVPAEVIRETAHAYARADRAMICWTLGITEHHHGVDNVLALINLSLLCGHVGRYGSGVNPLRGQNNVQGGGDMGAIPNKLVGFQDIERDAEARARFEAAWGTEINPHYGWHLTQMFHAMERGELRTLYVIGENPARSEADINHARQLLGALDLLVVQDIVWTATADYADVVFPGTASWCESEGTVTNSERRVQRVRRALDPPGDARDDMWIITELARRLGYDWGSPTAEDVWNEVRSLSPMHRGMRYDRLEELGGIQWPCPDDDHPGSPILHERLWEKPLVGPAAPFSSVPATGPFEALDAEYPIRLTTGRRLESFNTGAQSGLYRSPLHKGEFLDVSPEDADRLELAAGEIVRVSSRRGSVEAPVRVDPGLRAGLTFMTFHFPEQVDVNQLTIDATDPKSGTAEFKATAIRVEKLGPADRAERAGVEEPAIVASDT